MCPNPIPNDCQPPPWPGLGWDAPTVWRTSRGSGEWEGESHRGAGRKTGVLAGRQSLLVDCRDLEFHATRGRITGKGSKVKWCKNKPAIYSPAWYRELATHSILYQKYITEATKTTLPQPDKARIQTVVQYRLGHPTWIHLSQQDCFHRTSSSSNTPD